MSWVEEDITGNAALKENKPFEHWQEEEVNIPNMTVLDDDSGEVYSVPATFDEADIRFAIDTQLKQQPKSNFFGKVKAYGNAALDFSTGFGEGVEKGFLDFERGFIGFGGQAADTFLHASLSLPEKIERLKKVESGDFSDWDESLNGLITDEDIAAEKDELVKAAMIHKKALQERIIERRREKVEQVERIRQKLAGSIKKWQNILRPEEEQSGTERFIEMVGSGGASLGASVVTLMATKNPQVAAGILAGAFGRMRYTDVFDKSIKQGFDYDTADNYAMIAGTIEGGIELALEPILYNAANLRSVRKITDDMIGGAVAKLQSSAVGKKAAEKIVSKHTQSVGKQALKSALIEGTEEGLQESAGAYFENYVGLENTPQEEIISRTLLSFAVGGLTGAGAAVVGTSAYNREAMTVNGRIKDSLRQAYPELNEQENQKTADALQEIFYQDGEGRLLNELELLADKENDGDTVSGKHEISDNMRSILKDRYNMSDEEIDKTTEIAVTSIDMRNQFNETATNFYNELVNIGTDARIAEPASRLIAARAAAIALNEKTGLKDVVERWNLHFNKEKTEIDYNKLLDDEILFQLPKEAYKQNGIADINSSAFKSWFGKSKVIDEKGAPLVVYHGSNDKFEVFNDLHQKSKAPQGTYWFTESYSNAETYRISEAEGEIYPVYLKMDNPLVLDWGTKNFNDASSINIQETFLQRLIRKIKGKVNEGEILGEVFSDVNEVVNGLKLTGKYDGIIIKNIIDKGYFSNYFDANTSTDYIVFEPNQIKSVYNRGTFDANNDNIYLQSAFAGSRVDYDVPSLEAIGTGEGNQAHGWGLYYALNKNVAEGYREKFISDDNVKYKGKKAKDYYKEGDYVTFDAINAIIGSDFNLEASIKAMKEIYERNKSNEDIYNKAKAIYNKLKNFDIKDVEQMIEKGQVLEVDLPENPYLLDEDDLINNQSEYIRRTVHNILNSFPDTFIESNDIQNFGGMTGGSLYKELMFIAQKQGIENKNEQQKYASKILEEHGIKGITYDGVQDGRCFVIFNPSDVKVLNKFYQGQIANKGKHIELIINSVEEMRGLSEDDFKNKMLDTLKSFKGNKIFNHSLNDDIEIRTSSIKKYKSFFADKNKRLIVPYIPELLSKAKFDKLENSYMPDKETNVKAYYKADLPINIDSDVYNVHLTVKEDNHGNLFWDAQVQEKSPSAGPATNPGVKGLSSEISEDSLNITPKKENVNNSLYQAETASPRGQYDAAKKLITLFESADPSTIIHESAHFFLDDMLRFADNEETKQQLDAIYKYVGSENGSLTTEQHEYFARSFEAYLMEGKAPNTLLGKVFDKFKRWLRRIYGEIKNLNVKLNDNIRKTFDDMLGGRKLDFAMQLNQEKLMADIKAGNIPQTAINKAMRLLEDGKMSKADMEEMISRIEDGQLKRGDVKKYLEPFERSTNRHYEPLYEWDFSRYRRQLEKGNVTPQSLRQKIDRLLKWSEPRTQNGKVVGRFPDIKVNRFFDDIRQKIALKKDEAQAKIAANQERIDNITKGIETGNIADIIWENKILSIPAKRASVSLMADIYNDISEIYNTGRLGERVTGMVKRAYRERLIKETLNVLDKGNGRNWRKESGNLTKKMRRFGLSMFSWNGVLDVLSMYDKETESMKSSLSQTLTVFEEEKRMRMGIYEDGEVVSRLMSEALGENGTISVSRYINQELPKKFLIEWGDNSRTFTKNQLLDIYMKSKDPETREIMINDEILQFDNDFLARVDEQLTMQDIAVADALFKFYEETYNKLNDFYETHYGISLGHREFYSPRSMDKGGIDVVSGDLKSYAGLSAIKKRTAKGGQIKIKGAFNVLQNYISNSNHFIAFADKLQDINAVLGDAEVKNRIRNVFGEEMNKKIAYEISRFASNDKVFTQGVGGVMSKLRANYAVSVLGVKPSLAIKQLTSFPAYWENVPTADFLEGLADFAKHPKQAIETLGASAYMKTRGTNIIKDFEVISKEEMLKNLGTKIGLREFLMLNIKLGDRGAIYMGGWALYKSVLKRTGSKEKAMAEFERITNETQQSSYMSEQSAWQSNPFGNWFTMFQSSQNQYLRKELTALRGVATGRMPWDKAMKTLFIYHFLLPMFFQFVSDGFRWDKDAQLRTAVLGSLNGAFVLGKVMERLTDWAITGALNYKLGLKELFPPVSVLENTAKFLADSVKYAVDDISLEEYMDALKGGVRTIGEAAGLPLKYPLDVATTSKDYLEDEEYGKLGLLMLGWSPYALRDFEE